jgi:cytochrome c oxidase assembly protein subunit 15
VARAGRGAPPPRTSAPAGWPHRLAVLTLGATLVLVVAGGLVTNTGAALAVPDWPTTFGHNMFLFPWSGMVGGVLFEHGHRLLGAGVGMLTLALAAVLWRAERRGWVRGLGVLAVVLVCVQGLLGGLRVLWLRDALAIAHGCLAQAFVALVVALAAVTAREWSTPARPAGGMASTAWLSLAVAGALYAQVVLGALTTHAGWVTLHVAGAVATVLLGTVLASHVLGRHAGEPALTRPAGALAGLLVVQVGLGLGAYLARFTALAVPGGAPIGLALPVGHRLTASLLLGASVVLALRSWRRRMAVPEPAAPGERRLVSPGVAA